MGLVKAGTLLDFDHRSITQSLRARSRGTLRCIREKNNGKRLRRSVLQVGNLDTIASYLETDMFDRMFVHSERLPLMRRDAQRGSCLCNHNRLRFENFTLRWPARRRRRPSVPSTEIALHCSITFLLPVTPRGQVKRVVKHSSPMRFHRRMRRFEPPAINIPHPSSEQFVRS